jgi:pyridoxamine 5'-phosphate oxidase-like protein
MRESPADLERLQGLIDRSIEAAGPFLRNAFEMPDRSLSAEQLVDRLQGSVTVALATTTARGEPRVAPINALFVRAAFHVPTVAQAARTRHLAARPAASITYFEGTEMAVVAHGRVAIIDTADPGFAELDGVQVESCNESPTEWQGDGVYLRLDAERLFTYAR